MLNSISRNSLVLYLHDIGNARNIEYAGLIMKILFNTMIKINHLCLQELSTKLNTES